jgi:membrane-associated protease RseP (regulator of RpoE activity)
LFFACLKITEEGKKKYWIKREEEQMRRMNITVLVLLLPLTFFLLATTTSTISNSNPFSTKDRGWLGVSIKDLDYDMLDALGLKDKRGTMVIDVHPKSPADKAGIREDDIIIEFDGREIRDSDDLRRAVRRTRSGDMVKVKLVRQGREQELEVKIESRQTHDYSILKDFPHFDIHFSMRGSLGIQVQNLNPELGEYFGIKDGKGILIIKVRKDSAAKEAGFQAGDVIVKIAGKKVDDIEELQEILSEAEKGEKLNFEIMRKKKKLALSAELDFNVIHRYPSSHYYIWKGKLPDFPDELVIDIPEIELPNIDDIEINLKAHEKEMRKLKSKLEKIKRALNKKLRMKVKEEEISRRYLHEKIERELQRNMLEIKKHLKNQDFDIYIKKKVPDTVIIVRTA